MERELRQDGFVKNEQFDTVIIGCVAILVNRDKSISTFVAQSITVANAFHLQSIKLVGGVPQHFPCCIDTKAAVIQSILNLGLRSLYIGY